MNQKKGYTLIAVAIFTVIAASVFFSGCIEEKKLHDGTKVNADVIQIKDFSIKSISSGLNTSARGTIFIKGAEGISENAQIVALIEIDPSDWGGVAFDIPKGWQIAGIKSSYPENVTSATPEDYISTWTTADPDYERSTMIEVGRDRGYALTRGGNGTVVIDLVRTDASNQPDTAVVLITVGSDEKNGIKICGTDYIEIPLSSTGSG
jgi:hypothetical protein